MAARKQDKRSVWIVVVAGTADALAPIESGPHLRAEVGTK